MNLQLKILEMWIFKWHLKLFKLEVDLAVDPCIRKDTESFRFLFEELNDGMGQI